MGVPFSLQTSLIPPELFRAGFHSVCVFCFAARYRCDMQGRARGMKPGSEKFWQLGRLEFVRKIGYRACLVNGSRFVVGMLQRRHWALPKFRLDSSLEKILKISKFHRKGHPKSSTYRLRTTSRVPLAVKFLESLEPSPKEGSKRGLGQSPKVSLPHILIPDRMGA